MTGKSWYILAAISLFMWSLGFGSHALLRPMGDGIFYARCEGFGCEVRAHVNWWTRDPVIARGPAFDLTIGRDANGAPISQWSGQNFAMILSQVPGYGAHFHLPPQPQRK